MRPLDELINQTDPGWKIVMQMIDSAKNSIEILPADSVRAKNALYELQITSRSPLGAVVLNSGGILVDHGWIRILGSGSKRLDREVMKWNRQLYQSQNPGFLVIADDALGGFYLLNGGGLGEDIGNIYYFSPGNLEFKPMEYGYTTFLSFCFNGNLASYYNGYRWKNWKNDVSKLPGDKVFTFTPFLFSREAKDIDKTERGTIPINALFFFNLDMRKQLGLDKPDTIGHE
ncbi:MAG: hypothetical protein DI535_13005 [Citrobacter freundii]|nr:MAG: hypothetical protein DI535_13005 [Citrobacter freundii]